MQRTAAPARPISARSVTFKKAASGMRAWLFDSAVAVIAIAGVALATALTTH